MKNICEEKSFDFAVRIVGLYKYLAFDCKEYILSKQIVRCGTSIGANVSEAQKAQSKADFVAKMSIALKEANETQYWLKLLYKTGYIFESSYSSLFSNADELISLLTAICKKASEKK